MKITFDTQNEQEVQEVTNLLQMMALQSNGNVPSQPKEVVTNTNTASKDKKPSEASKPSRKAKAKKTASSITLGDLKAVAQEAVGRTDRQKVKEVISQYAEKLNEVSEEDYQKLFDTLKGM